MKINSDSSYKMSLIRGKNTSIERSLGNALWKIGLRYRKHYKKLKGTPDFVLVKNKIAIFCDSAFWHGYRNMSTKIHRFKSNKKFWTDKIKTNIERDKSVNRILKREGWKVVRLWDYEIKENIDTCVEKLKLSISP